MRSKVGFIILFSLALGFTIYFNFADHGSPSDTSPTVENDQSVANNGTDNIDNDADGADGSERTKDSTANNESATEVDTNVDVRPEVGFRAPDFELPLFPTDEGKTVRLSELDKPVVVNFWASWCGPCHIEAPDFTKAYEKYGEDVEIVAINLRENDDKVRGFVEEYGFEFLVPIDEKGAIAEEYQIFSIPSTFFVNKDGIIIHKVTGIVPGSVLESYMQQMID